VTAENFDWRCRAASHIRRNFYGARTMQRLRRSFGQIRRVVCRQDTAEILTCDSRRRRRQRVDGRLPWRHRYSWGLGDQAVPDIGGPL
jgi:hypothetical protein